MLIKRYFVEEAILTLDSTFNSRRSDGETIIVPRSSAFAIELLGIGVKVSP